MYSILGIINTQSLSTTLLKNLSYNKGYQILNSACLRAGQIQNQRPQKHTILTSLLPPYLNGDFISHLDLSNDSAAYFRIHPELIVNYCGYLENDCELREELIHLGYPLESLGNPSDIITHLVNYYLSIGMSATEINLLLMSRLQGRFSLIILLAGQEDTLIAISQGMQLTLAFDMGVLYLASCSQTLRNLVPEATLLAYEQPLHRLILTPSDYQKLMAQLDQFQVQGSPLATVTV